MLKRITNATAAHHRPSLKSNKTKETTRKTSSPRRLESACSARSMPARRSSGKKREINWNFPLVLRSAFASTPPTAHAGNFDTEARTGTFAWAMHDAQRCVDATRYPRILSTRKGRVNPGRFVALFREGCRVSIDTSELDFFRPQKKKKSNARNLEERVHTGKKKLDWPSDKKSQRVVIICDTFRLKRMYIHFHQ